MSIIKSISSINPVSNKSILSNSISYGVSSSQSDNSLSWFGNGLGNTCNPCGFGGSSNIINIDIDIGRRRRRCC